MAIITLNNNSLSSVTALPTGIVDANALASGVGGKVLQVVSSTIGSVNMTSSGYVGSGLSITPSSTSSKVLVIFGGRAERYSGTSTDYDQLELRRATSNIYTITDAHLYNLSNGVRQFFNVNYLDSPATTSSTQYRLYDSSAGGNESYYQSWTLLEVAG